MTNKIVLSFFVLFCFSKTGFLCVALELVLELTPVHQIGLELTETHLPLPPPSAGIKGVQHHRLAKIFPFLRDNLTM